MLTRKPNTHSVPNFDPDSVFLDSYNVSRMDQSQMEGKMETPISHASVYLFMAIMFLVVLFFIGRSGYLQIVNNEKYLALANVNRFDKSIIFARRGNIYDRNSKELAWSAPQQSSVSEQSFDLYAKREYISTPGFAHVLGYVSYPAKDKNGNWWRKKYEGVAGIEKIYDTQLSGQNGAHIVEIDASGKIQNQNILTPPKSGKDLHLAIDAQVQEQLFKAVAETVEQTGYNAGSAAIMDVNTGEILALVSYPEYDSSVMSEKTDVEKIQYYLNSPRQIMLNRAISALYAPGSIVKPYIALAALSEKIISPSKHILSTGQLVVPNPFNPDKPSVFKDWKAHGFVDMRKAIAVSSNVYFFAVGGGLDPSSGLGFQKGLGIYKIVEYAKKFGLSLKTGIDLPGEVEGNLPTPEWKKEVFNQDWLLGDTYNSSIGQFGWLITPIQALRYVSAVANGGKLLKPQMLKDAPTEFTDIKLNQDDLKVIQEGMRMAVTDGTLKAINFDNLQLAGKTGTAQFGARNQYKHSWVIGFWPYDKPRYAFVINMEKAPISAKHGAIIVARKFFDWLSKHEQVLK